VLGYLAMVVFRKRGHEASDGAQGRTGQRYLKETQETRNTRDTWRMPALDELPPPNLTLTKRIWMGVLRAYLIVAVGLVVVKVVQMIWVH